jgi:hypothetical protein
MVITIETVIELILQEAEQNRQAAGMSGRWDDGGAKELEMQVEYYRYGRDGRMPPTWQSYADRAGTMLDPEYATYQRLKEKFKGK